MTMTTRQKWEEKGQMNPGNNPFERQPHHATARNIFSCRRNPVLLSAPEPNIHVEELKLHT